MKYFELKKNEMGELEKKLGLKFRNKNLLIQALTHCSAKKNNPQRMGADNERLEFFGDAVLKLAVSEHFYKKFPQAPEGDLTKLRAGLVSDVVLARVAREIGLGKYIFLGASEKKAGEDDRSSILAAAVEALIGAAYLDRGLAPAQKIVFKMLGSLITEAEKARIISDPKSKLQEEVQKLGWTLPVYRVIKERGPEHQKTFFMEVTVGPKDNLIKGQGKGVTKKTAEQFAAKNALEKFPKLT